MMLEDYQRKQQFQLIEEEDVQSIVSVAVVVLVNSTVAAAASIAIKTLAQENDNSAC